MSMTSRCSSLECWKDCKLEPALFFLSSFCLPQVDYRVCVDFSKIYLKFKPTYLKIFTSLLAIEMRRSVTDWSACLPCHLRFFFSDIFSDYF